MGVPPATQGDVFLLFEHLPLDFNSELPLPLGQGVCIDNTPFSWLESAQPGVADYVLPGYSLRIPISNACLRAFPISSRTELQPHLLFNALLALRLYAPLPIRVEGRFRVGPSDNRILEHALYHIESPWSPANTQLYSATDVRHARSICDKLLSIEQLGPSRLQTAVLLFSQITVGMSWSFQLATLGLFAALEALFVPKEKKARTISRRVACFLEGFRFPEPMESWLEKEYVKLRSTISHGIDDAILGQQLRPERGQVFGRLHEIARLALLGFLSLSTEDLTLLSGSSGTRLQRALDQLKPISGEFLQNQKMWLDGT